MYPCIAAQCKAAAECASGAGTASESHSNSVSSRRTIYWRDGERRGSAMVYAQRQQICSLASPPHSRQFAPQPSIPGSKHERCHVDRFSGRVLIQTKATRVRHSREPARRDQVGASRVLPIIAIGCATARATCSASRTQDWAGVSRSALSVSSSEAPAPSHSSA